MAAAVAHWRPVCCTIVAGMRGSHALAPHTRARFLATCCLQREPPAPSKPAAAPAPDAQRGAVRVCLASASVQLAARCTNLALKPGGSPDYLILMLLFSDMRRNLPAGSSRHQQGEWRAMAG
jgi:hypothetical protein